MTTRGNSAQTANASGRSSKLPDEIIEAQKCRSDMLKWKLVLVAVLGAAGLGLSEKVNAAPLVLCMIPFVCLYVDLLCCNNNVRQILIGSYYNTCEQDAYECFVGKHRRAFALEDWALFWSTRVLCALVTLAGVLLVAGALVDSPRPAEAGVSPVAAGNQTPGSVPQTYATNRRTSLTNRLGFHWQGGIVAMAGIAGIGLSLFTRSQYLSRIDLHCLEIAGWKGGEKRLRHRKLEHLLRTNYTEADLEKLNRFLVRKHVFDFIPLENGLFPATACARPQDKSGYHHVWVRDNVHVAYAHYSWGERAKAARTVSTLLEYFQKHRHRFGDIIEGRVNPSDPMNRPHVRFDGEKLTETDQKWPHAQNDALGYFLWCYCRLAQDESLLPCGEKELTLLAQFPRYFGAIQYWQDRDSGHWEETRKVSASSIGAVLAGLREFERLVEQRRGGSDPVMKSCGVTSDLLQELQKKGQDALKEILPGESKDPACRRPYDSALLFLIYPLEVLRWSQAGENQVESILENIRTQLEGEHGIRRYEGDSYWCADYETLFPPEVRTGDFSENMQQRDAHLRLGEEAQWCLFDPIVSVIWGQRYHESKTGDENADEWLQRQTKYFNRALSQLTSKKTLLPRFRSPRAYYLPEAYYLKKGCYVPNPHRRLLWAHANLRLAVHEMRRSAKLAKQGG